MKASQLKFKDYFYIKNECKIYKVVKVTNDYIYYYRLFTNYNLYTKKLDFEVNKITKELN